MRSIRFAFVLALCTASSGESWADILVNNPALDTGGTTQSETTVVVNGNTVCAAWNDAGEGYGANGFSGFGVSSDGGVTFTDRGPFPNGPGVSNSGDPSLAYSVRDSAFYYSALSSVGLSLWKSTDGCQNFAYVGPIHVGGDDDKELLAIDNTPSSPFYGRMYVGWTDFSLGVDREVVSFSDNGGLAWSAPVSLPGSGTAGQGMWPVVAPNGDVYFAFERRSFAIGGLHDQFIYRSTNGGVNWVKMTDLVTARRRPENVTASVFCGRQALNPDIRNLSSPQIAIHTDASAPAGYVIHATYPSDSDGVGPDESNVFYRRSTDGAVTWSPEVQLNDDGTTRDQWFPSLGVNAQGTVVVSWYDRRLDAADTLFDRFATVSTDAGLSFAANVRISDVSSPVSVNNPHFDGLATCYHGDYDQLVVDAGAAHFVWSDDRRVTGTGPNPDVYYDQLLLNQPPDCNAAAADLGTLWPPNKVLTSISVVGVTDPDGDPLTITPTGVAQDEAVLAKGAGSGDTTPDATLSPLAVRSERDGNPKTPGNGRVYHIDFTADDGNGGTCDGTVKVCVPHDQGAIATCVDDGPLYDSIP